MIGYQLDFFGDPTRRDATYLAHSLVLAVWTLAGPAHERLYVPSFSFSLPRGSSIIKVGRGNLKALGSIGELFTVSRVFYYDKPNHLKRILVFVRRHGGIKGR